MGTITPGWFDEIDSEYKSYCLGFILGDGCIRHISENSHTVKIEIQEGDKDVILEMAEHMNFIGKIYEYKVKSRASEKILSKCCLSIIDKTTANTLDNKYGIEQRKSTTTLTRLNMPKDPIFFLAFLRGLFDSNGNICSYPARTGGMDGFVSFFHGPANLPMMLEIKDKLLSYFGVKASSAKKYKSCVKLTVCGEDAKNILKLMYENSNIFLKRKKDHALYFIANKKSAHRVDYDKVRNYIKSLNTRSFNIKEQAKKIGIAEFTLRMFCYKENLCDCQYRKKAVYKNKINAKNMK